MSTNNTKRAFIICLIALFIGFIYLMKPFLMPMVLAMAIVTIFYPLFLRIKKKFKERTRLASVASTLIIFLIIILPSTWIAAMLINQVYGIVGNLDLKATFANVLSTEFYSQHVAPWITDMETRFQVKINLLGVLTDAGREVARSVTSYSPSVLFGTANFLFGFLVMLFGVYFLFVEGPGLVKLLMDISPLQPEHEKKLLDRVSKTIHATVYGYIVTGIVQGLIAAALFAFVGIKAFIILGVMTFFMSMVPVIGATGVWLPVCIWLFVQGNTWQGVVVLIGGAGLVSTIDNFLKPIVIQGKTKIHPLLVFFSLFGGIMLFGPAGILFGPMITALLIAVIKIYREEYV